MKKNLFVLITAFISVFMAEFTFVEGGLMTLNQYLTIMLVIVSIIVYVHDYSDHKFFKEETILLAIEKSDYVRVFSIFTLIYMAVISFILVILVGTDFIDNFAFILNIYFLVTTIDIQLKLSGKA